MRRLALLLSLAACAPAPEPPAPVSAPEPVAPAPPAAPTLDSWSTRPGFQVAVAAEGLRGPVDIAFVPNPGPLPDAVLFLVTQLGGEIRAVRRDGTHSAFGTLPGVHRPARPLPWAEAAYGLHGLCFAPDGETLYTTSVAEHDGALQNRIHRWRPSADDWSTGEADAGVTTPFDQGWAKNGHSIGNCFFGDDGKLWVGTGDGNMPPTSHDPNTANGKLLRFEPDLSAARDNPDYDAAHPTAPASFIHSRGYRNPWAIAQGPTGVYVADNGPGVDRLLRPAPGTDHPWDGGDGSMLFGNLMVWSQAIGPADLVHVDSPLFPDHANTLWVSAPSLAGVMRVPLTADGVVAGPPKLAASRTGGSYSTESVNGVALGPDGLYFAHMVYGPSPAEPFAPSAIYRLTWDAAAGAQGTPSGGSLFVSSGCIGCHALNDKGGRAAPPLDGIGPRIEARLADPNGTALQGSSGNPTWDAARAAVLAAPPEDRVAAWIEQQIRHPGFDGVGESMPALPLPEADVLALAEYLAHR